MPPRAAAAEPSGNVKRSYRSPLREKRATETRAALVATARALFLARGWAGTSMRDVAAEAGVAMETVYAHFSSKRELLRAVNDTAVVGDDEAIPLAQRPAFTALGRGRRAQRIRAAAAVLTDVHSRTALLAKVLREAAPNDEEIAADLRATGERQRQDVAAGFALIVGRPPTPTERDGLWAIASPQVYLLLVEESGWTPERFEDWMAETMERVIPRS